MGKHKYIETPERMYELFEAYKKETKENPRTKIEYVGKDGLRVKTPLETPLTMEGFSGYVYRQGVNDKHTRLFREYTRRLRQLFEHLYAHTRRS
jgi:hypothetical protein